MQRHHSLGANTDTLSLVFTRTQEYFNEKIHEVKKFSQQVHGYSSSLVITEEFQGRADNLL